MVGRPLTKARREAEAAAAAASGSKPSANLPTERRTQPVTFSDELLVEMLELGDAGLADAEIAAHWRLSEHELKQMEIEHPDLATAHNRARTLAKARWLSWIRTAVSTGDNRFAAGSWSQYMRAMHPEFDDKTSVRINIDVTDRLVMVDLRADQPAHQPADVIEGVVVEGASDQRAIGDAHAHARDIAAPEPTVDRLLEGDNPLIDRASVRLPTSQTSENTPPAIDHPSGRGGRPAGKNER